MYWMSKFNLWNENNFHTKFDIFFRLMTNFHISVWALLIQAVEKVMAPHSSTLAWKIPWMEEPGSLQSMGSLRVGHDWVTSLSHIGEGNGNPLQCSCLENPRDEGAWWAAVYGVTQSQTQLKRLRSSSSNSSCGCGRDMPLPFQIMGYSECAVILVCLYTDTCHHTFL